MLAAVLTYLPVFQGRQLGNYPDSPWTVSLFEHWYRVLTSVEAVRHTNFFYPDPNALGYSDAFLTQGILYAPLRLFGLDPVASWSVTNFIMLCGMNLGFAVLAAQFLRRRTMIVFIVLIGTLNYAFVTQLSHVQTLGFGLTYWLLALLVATVRNPERGSRLFVPLLLPIFLLQTLTAWYATVFTLLIGLLSLVASMIVAPLLLTSVRGNLGLALRLHYTRHTLSAALSAGLSVGLLAVWMYIYYPSFQSASKPWTEYVSYAPTNSDIINVSQGAGLWQNFLRTRGLFEGTASMEQASGVTPVMFLVFLVATGIALGLVARGSAAIRVRLFLVIALTSLAALMLFLVDARGQGLYRLFWTYVPGAATIRSPLRINILLVPLMALGLGMLFEFFLDKGSRNRQSARRFLSLVVISVVTITITVEQHRGVNAAWTRGDYVSERFENVPSLLQNAGCQSFLMSVEPIPGEQWWEIPVQAVNIAVLSGVPTVNGYSGNSPASYPNFLDQTPAMTEALISWSRANGGGEPCVVRIVNGEVRVGTPPSGASTLQ